VFPAPGSSNQFLRDVFDGQSGPQPADAAYIGVGIGPSVIAAIKEGDIDAFKSRSDV